jgi:lipopolysaccharide transport system ATP-binding protein
MSTTDLAISVRELGKSYTIYHNQNRATTLAEAVAGRIKSPRRQPKREVFWALRKASFDVLRGQVVGVLGRNGAGKSTLLKILSRITEPTEGCVDLYGRVSSLLEVGTGFHGELSGRENIYLNGTILGMKRKEIERQFEAIVDFAGVEKFLDTPVKRYSSGMYVRLAFAVAAHLQSEILLVDEVLAVGDAQFQRKCLGKMKDAAAAGKTALFVSHNMAAVSHLCTHGIFMEGGSVSFVGKTEEAVSQYLKVAPAGEFLPASGVVRRVAARQEGAKIFIEADFEMGEATGPLPPLPLPPLSLPNLGFVIHDLMGTPICGSNAFLNGVERLEVPMRRGRVAVEITDPILLDGQYQVSIWFGDGKQDFVSHPHCLSFEVRGMAGPRQHSAAAVGSVKPRCEFRFFDPDEARSTLTGRQI